MKCCPASECGLNRPLIIEMLAGKHGPENQVVADAATDNCKQRNCANCGFRAVKTKQPVSA